MKNWGRRIRAAIGMGLSWAVAWAAASWLLARLPGVNTDLPLGFLLTPIGFAIGVIFSGILVAVAGRRGADRLSIPRFAGWGAASGLLMSGIIVAGAALRGENLLGAALVLGPVIAAASAACAAGSLALARRAERLELSGADGELAELGLTEAEKRELLGRGG